MILDELHINPHTQSLYAEIIAIEDISEGNNTELLESKHINIGETAQW